MGEVTDSLYEEIERRAAALEARTEAAVAWSFADLASGAVRDARGDEPVPVGDQEGLIQYLALAEASIAGEADLDAKYALEDRHRDDGRNDVIGCMSNGLVLSLGDYLAQTVITGDAAAFAVVREAVASQGLEAQELVDRYLSDRGAGPVQGRPVLSETGSTGVRIGSTTTNEQLQLLRGLLEDAGSGEAEDARRAAAQRALKVLSSVLKGGGLSRGLPGYGPFKTKVVHSARIGNGNSVSVRSDAAIYFHEDEPRFLASVCVHGFETWPGAIPGMALAEDFIRDLSRSCWAHTVGTF